MIHDLLLRTPPDLPPHAFLGRVLPGPWFGIALLWLGVGTLLWTLRGGEARARGRGAGAAIGLLYLATLVLTLRWIDDVMVNLSHPYNLLHHGRFSASPEALTNGTVELAYYGLLTPLAFTRDSLVVGNFATQILLGAGVLALMHGSLQGYSATARLLATAFVALAVPLQQNFSNGYGGGLVLLLTALAVRLASERRFVAAELIGALLPLVRVDALLVVVALGAGIAWSGRRVPWRLALGAASSLALFSVVMQLTYGFVTPTPVMLREVSLAELVSALDRLPAALVMYPLYRPFSVLVLGLALVALRRGEGPPARLVGPMLVVLLAAVPLFLLGSFFSWNPALYRYFAAQDLVAVWLAAHLVARSVERGWSQVDLVWRLRRAIAVFAVSVTSLGTVGVAVRGPFATFGAETYVNQLPRMTLFAFAGVLLDRVLPADWRIATTEMNTFGFASGRPVLDLWGFSNREIALSEERGQWGLRVHSGLFLRERPEVLWVRTYDPRTLRFNFQENSPELVSRDPRPVIDGLARLPNTGPGLAQSGDLREVMRSYDVVRLFHEHGPMSLLLVRKDAVEELVERLAPWTTERVAPFPVDHERLAAAFEFRRCVTCRFRGPQPESIFDVPVPLP